MAGFQIYVDVEHVDHGEHLDSQFTNKEATAMVKNDIKLFKTL